MKVSRGKPQILGIDRQYAGLINVRVSVDPTPDQAWAEIFKHPDGYGHSVGMHHPALLSDVVELQVIDGKMKETIAALDERIAATNAYHEREIEPRKQAERETRQRAHEDEKRRLDQAQQDIDELDDSDG